MHAQVYMRNVSDSLNRLESPLNALSARERHGALLAWG
jgi:hypothetical protein